MDKKYLDGIEARLDAAKTPEEIDAIMDEMAKVHNAEVASAEAEKTLSSVSAASDPAEQAAEETEEQTEEES